MYLYRDTGFFISNAMYCLQDLQEGLVLWEIKLSKRKCQDFQSWGNWLIFLLGYFCLYRSTLFQLSCLYSFMHFSWQKMCYPAWVSKYSTSILVDPKKLDEKIGFRRLWIRPVYKYSRDSTPFLFNLSTKSSFHTWLVLRRGKMKILFKYSPFSIPTRTWDLPMQSKR